MEKILTSHKAVDEECLHWIELWGYQLAYAITQSTDLSEDAVAAAAIAYKTNTQESSNTKRKFLAARIIDAARKNAFRGVTTEEFYKISPHARAAVSLKVKGRFSTQDIADIFKVPQKTVESMLEQARLSFTKGRTWLATGKRRPDCPKLEDGKLFSRYIENDMTTDDTLSYYKHFSNCGPCRNDLKNFKAIYSDWLFSLPEVEATKTQIGYFRKTMTMAKNITAADRITEGPSFWFSIKKLFEERETQLLVLSFALFMILFELVSTS